VRGASESDLLARQVVFFDPAVLDEGNGLEGLGRRAKADGEGGIARYGERPARGVDDDDRAGVK